MRWILSRLDWVVPKFGGQLILPVIALLLAVLGASDFINWLFGIDLFAVLPPGAALLETTWAHPVFRSALAVVTLIFIWRYGTYLRDLNRRDQAIAAEAAEANARRGLAREQRQIADLQLRALSMWGLWAEIQRAAEYVAAAKLEARQFSGPAERDYLSGDRQLQKEPYNRASLIPGTVERLLPFEHIGEPPPPPAFRDAEVRLAPAEDVGDARPYLQEENRQVQEAVRHNIQAMNRWVAELEGWLGEARRAAIRAEAAARQELLDSVRFIQGG